MVNFFSYTLLWIGDCGEGGEGNVYKTSTIFFSPDLGSAAM